MHELFQSSDRWVGGVSGRDALIFIGVHRERHSKSDEPYEYACENIHS
jgi:hypothetical protein